MEILCALGGKVVDLTVQPICRQFGYLIFYKSNMEGLKEQLERLRDKREDIQHSVDVAQSDGEEIGVQVKRWLERVQEITAEAEEFFPKESQAKTDCSFKTCLNLWLRHQRSRRAKKLTHRVSEIMEEEIRFISHPVPVQGVEASSFTSISTFNIEAYESRLSTLDEIMKELRDPTINMIGLYGLGGVGKTTLTSHVAKKAKEEKLFDIVIIVRVAQNPDLEKIQRQVAEVVGIKLDNGDEIMRAGHLCNQLKKLKEEKNILVVLDDLWERLDVQKLGIHFADDSQSGSSFANKENKVHKFILTSRNKDVLYRQMNCKRIIELGVLPTKEAWQLFKEMAKLQVDSDPESLLSIASQVALRCGGLPVSLVAVARALRNNKNLSEWRNTLRRLEKPLLRTITVAREVDSSLMLSYDFLSSQQLRSTFLLSAMLSQEPSIIELFMYSFGLGLLHQDINNMEQAQDELIVLVSKLKASSLLLEGTSDDCFTIHDVVRDFALSIASKEHDALVVRHGKLSEWPKKEQLEGCTTICLEKSDISEFPEDFCCPRLELFLINAMNTDLRISSKFFKAMQKLKVMSLTNMHFSSLPSSISLLEELKTLCLHSCTLEDIVVVGKLKKLKVLSFADSTIKQLPCEVGQLRFLQMLNLANCSKLEVIPANVISRLNKLEVLYMENSFHQWEAEGPDRVVVNASLAELKQLPKLSTLDVHITDASVLPRDLFMQHSLEKYRIFIGEDWEWNGRYRTSKTLKVKTKVSIQFGCGFQRLLESVEELHLDELNGIRNILYELNAAGFPNLKHLWIENNEQIEFIIDSRKGVRCVGAFPNLETLVLHKLKGLKKLCHGWISGASFQNLREIKVKWCDQLQSVFSISRVEILSKLVEIEICDCNLVKEIVVLLNHENFGQNSVTKALTFHQLRSLKLENLPKLRSFCFVEKNESVSLTHCNVVEDDPYSSSKSLFSNEVSFDSIEQLTICGINVRSILAGPTSESSPIQNSALVEFQQFSNLKSLLVQKCSLLLKLIPFHLLKLLRSLEELIVSDCESLEMVFDFEGLNSNEETHALLSVPLKKLTVSTLPNLKYVWGKHCKGIIHYQSLQKVRVANCARLESIFPLSIAKDLCQLEELKIYDCGTVAIVERDQEAEGAHSFVFPMLKVVELMLMRNLRNFYPGRHTLEWPQLQKLRVHYCEQVKMFQSDVPSIAESHEQMARDTNDPLFVDVKAIPNLEELSLGGKHATMIWNGQSSEAYLFREVKVLKLEGLNNNAQTFPCGLLKRFPNLEQLDIGSGWLSEIFSGHETPGDDAGRIAPLKRLDLYSMDQLKHIWNENCQVDFILQNLESLRVSWCGGLISLGPSSVSFVNLTDLKVYRCRGLINLLNPSTAASLANLTRLSITDCEEIEEIISCEGHDADKVIIFKKLEVLELTDLPRLKSFCCHNYTFVFPSLKKVIIRGLLRLKLFCPGVLQTPLFMSVEVEKNESHWDNNLNKTIQQLYEQQVGLRTISSLEIMDDEYSDKLRDIWSKNVPHHGCFSNLTSLKLVSWNLLSNCVIPSHLLRNLSNLEELDVRDCYSVQAVFDVEGINIDKGAQSLVVMKLNVLHLDNLQNLKCIWNKDPLGIICFQNLELVFAQKCERLTSIFPASIAQGLTELQELDIDSCGVEVIIDEDRTGLDGAASFGNLRCLRVVNCNFLANCVIPSHLLTNLRNLQEMEVSDCELVETVFDVDGINIDDGTQSLVGMSLRDLKLSHLRNLKCIWNKDPLGINYFKCLKQVRVAGCERLRSIFPASIAKGLTQLEVLYIASCGVEAIIEEDKTSLEAAASFVFPNLSSLSLWRLTNLRNFYPQRHTCEFPQLRKLQVYMCKDVDAFGSQVAIDSVSHEKAGLETQHPPFLVEKVVPNLEVLRLNQKSVASIRNGEFQDDLFNKVEVLDLESFCDDPSETFPYSFLKRFPKLEKLGVFSSSFEELFPCRGPIYDLLGEIVPFKELCLSGLDYLKHIWSDNSQLHPFLQNLKIISVSYCKSLINLAPSSASFDNLRCLNMSWCCQLSYLVTSSTARSLIHLEKLKINDCKTIEEIVTNGREDVEDGIAFRKLGQLELNGLENLKTFCSQNYTFEFPKLKEVVITGCPKMEMFCSGVVATPLLNGVYEELNKGKYWEGNLNKTIQRMFAEKVAFHTLSSLELMKDEYPELRDIWNGDVPHHKYFGNLRSLKLVNCNFLANCVIPSHLLTYLRNLQELEVRNCDLVETVFDVEGINIDEGNYFQCLKQVYVEECERLRSIFPASIAKGLTKLEQLYIVSCGVEVIIGEDKTCSETSPSFVFPNLSSLSLWGLSNLKNFYPERHTCEWRSLKWLYVWMCKNVEVFGTEVVNLTESYEKHGVEIKHPLFLVEKVIPNLEGLALNQKSVALIMNSEFQDNLFHKVEILYLESFCDDPAVAFPYGFLVRFPNLKELHVNRSTFLEIFPCQGPICEHQIGEIPAFKSLCLAFPDSLKNIWSDGSWLQTIVQNLEYLIIEKCGSLINLAPPSASFDNLATLEVSGCHQMTYLVTSSTAKSLVNLRTLKINDCKMIEEIIRNGREDAENEIVFRQLSELELKGLESLKTFCSQNYTFKFPELCQAVINECPKLEIFCPGDLATPQLKCVYEELYNPKHWGGHLNKTIQEMFIAKGGHNSSEF